MNEISQQIILILGRILKQEKAKITEDSSPSNLDGWDSLVQVELIAGVEEQFDIAFSLKDLPRLVSIKSFTEVVEQKLHP